MLGGLIGRAVAAAAKTVAAAAINAAANELRKPETQAKLGASVDAVTTTLRDPERRRALEAGAARALGRMAGRVRHAIAERSNDDPPGA